MGAHAQPHMCGMIQRLPLHKAPGSLLPSPLCSQPGTWRKPNHPSHKQRNESLPRTNECLKARGNLHLCSYQAHKQNCEHVFIFPFLVSFILYENYQVSTGKKSTQQNLDRELGTYQHSAATPEIDGISACVLSHGSWIFCILNSN